MITTKMFADALGISVDEAKPVIRNLDLETTKVGRTSFLDEKGLRHYADVILPAQIERHEQKKQEKIEWKARLDKYLDKAEQDPDTPEDFMTVMEASEILGVTTPVVLTRLRQGLIPGRQIGSFWFVRKSYIKQVLDQRESKSNDNSSDLAN